MMCGIKYFLASKASKGSRARFSGSFPMVFCAAFLMTGLFTGAFAQSDNTTSNATSSQVNMEEKVVLSYTQSELSHFNAKGPLVIELFTSVHCPFCPEADKLLRGLTDHADVMGLTCHVDYYDVRENPLSREFCTQRQNDYISKIDNSSLYTPQMIVNGSYGMNGQKSGQLLTLVQDEVQGNILPIDVIHLAGGINPASGQAIPAINKTPQTDKNIAGYVRLDLPTGSEANEIRDLWLVWYKHRVKAQNTRQSSRKSAMIYRNVVISAEKLAWPGPGQSLTIPDAYKGSGYGMMVLGQGASGTIKAAGQINWPDRREYN